MNKHDCLELHSCEDHPKWRVQSSFMVGVWYSLPPGQETFPTPDEHMHATHAEAIQFATSRARAEALAAVQSAEGQAASPTPPRRTTDERR